MKSTTQFHLKDKGNGNLISIKTFSYVGILCRKGGDEVKAVRLDNFERMTDARKAFWEKFPDWNVKEVRKLYDEDFAEGIL